MSVRTIIEINHDCIDRMTHEDFERLLTILRCGGLKHWDGCPPPTGIRILAQRFHWTKLKLLVE